MLQAAIHQDENFKKLDRDNFIKNANEELEHIIGKMKSKTDSHALHWAFIS